MNEFDFSRFDREKFESIVYMLMMNASSISFGECAVSLKVHNGSICTVLYSNTNKKLEDFKEMKEANEQVFKLFNSKAC